MRSPSMKTIEDIKLQGLNVSNPIDSNIFKKNKAINNQIYVFMSKTLNTILGCSLGKLGDSINPEKRVFKEWYPELQEVFDDIELILTLPAVWWDKENPWIVHMVRDYSFHTYLRENLYMKMVEYFSPEYLNQVFKGAKISQEFYIFDYFSKEEIIQIVKEAMEDIKKDITNPASPYKYYSYKISETNKELIFNSEKVRFKRDKDFGLRDFQKNIAHKNARYAIRHRHKGLNNYTMIVAPTRAGKTHTALTELKTLIELAKLEESLTLVITGIVPALYEWVESCESHVSFKDLYIYTMKELRDNPNLIKEARDRGEKHIIVAASLQDLAGSNRNKGVKYNHKFLEEEKLTKIFVDEAHYAMLNRSPEYSKILHNDEYSDFEDLTGLNKKDSKKFAKNIGTIEPEYGVSYITATPYDALYSGLFDFNENNTSIITAQDIQEEHKKWCRENPDKPENQSPYFAIPQPFSYRVPVSMPWEQLLETTPDGDLIHYDYIKKMFSDLFGVTTQRYSANIFNNKLFKENRLGNGIIITVERQKIADQLEDILNEVLEEKNYSILNISSNRGNKYSDMTTNRIQQVIENITNKFIVITVNRMMTGSTIRKVDTVLFARHISSASALIQYLGRAGSPYVVEVESDEIDPTTGNKKTEKVCMKPYCAALFLDPTAALTVHDQQLKFHVDHKDYSDSEEGAYRAATQELLETNPIIDYDEVTGQLREMTVNDIMSLTIEHSKYLTDPFRSRIKGVNAFNIKNIDSDSIVKLNNLVFKSAGIQDLIVNYFDEEKYDSDSPEGVCKIKDCGLVEFKDFLCVKHYKDLDSKVKETIDRVEKDTVSKKNSADNHMIELLDRMDDLTVQCMIYVVLHPDTIRSMREVVKSARDTIGSRIVKNIGLDVELLEHFIDHNVFKPSVDMLLEQQELIYSEMDGDSKIVDIMKSLKSLSVNEIISSDTAVKLLNDKIDFSVLSDSPAFLDNGCKSGVILIDIARRLKEEGYSDSIIRNALWCVPTSGLTYEIIRLVYESYGWNTDHILWAGGDYSALEVNDFLVRYQYDKIDKNSSKDMFMVGLFDEVLKDLYVDRVNVNQVNNNDIIDNVDNFVKMFDYVVSNPPYQVITSKSSSGRSYAAGIYDKFHKYAYDLTDEVIMIYPATWQRDLTAGHGKWLVDSGLKSAYNFDGQDLFGQSIRKDYPITIVHTSCGYNGDMHADNDFIISRKEENWISQKNIQLLVEKTKNCKKLNLGNLITDTSIKNVPQLESQGILLYKDNNKIEDPVKIYIKKTAGTIADSENFYVSRTEILDKFSGNIDKAKTAIRTRFFIQNQAFNEVINDPSDSFRIQVFDKNHIFGQTLTELREFDTFVEATNFANYLNSRFATLLLSIKRKKKGFGSLVPDLEDYTDNNPDIDWSKPLDPQLCNIFNIEDISVLKKV